MEQTQYQQDYKPNMCYCCKLYETEQQTNQSPCTQTTPGIWVLVRILSFKRRQGRLGSSPRRVRVTWNSFGTVTTTRPFEMVSSCAMVGGRGCAISRFRMTSSKILHTLWFSSKERGPDGTMRLRMQVGMRGYVPVVSTSIAPARLKFGRLQWIMKIVLIDKRATTETENEFHTIRSKLAIRGNRC